MAISFNNLQYSLRQLRKTPAFTLVCVLTLALGIGANTAVFSVMNAVLLRSLPVKDPASVVYLRTSNTPRNTGTINTQETFPYTVYDALRRQGHGISPILAYVPLSSGKVAVRLGAQPEEAEGEMVSGAFFSGLGVSLARGRGFTEEDESSHAPIAVLSWNYWTSRLARNPDVLGKPITVNGVQLTIVGVAAQGFEGVESGQSTDFWIPLQDSAALNAYGNPLEDGKTYLHNPTWWCMRLIGRLQPGVSRAQAAIQLQSAFQRAAYLGIGTPQPGERIPTLSAIEARSFPGYDEQYGKPLRMLMTMVALVLLIALSNVAMLLIARNAVRQREFSLRLALGAARGHLFRQLLTESAILVASGGALAWLFAAAATRALARWAQIESSLAPDSTVLLFTLAVLALAALVFGLAPLRIALSAGAAQALKTSASTANTDAARSRTSRIVVALQMTLCVVLLVGGGLLIRTLRNLQNTPLGMNTDGLVVFGVKPNTTTLAEGRIFYLNLLDKLRALPGVENATVVEERLGSGWSDNSAMKVDGKLPEVSGDRTVRSNVAGPDFFKTLGVPVLMGRDFTTSDTSTSQVVGIINQTFADRFLPGRNPLGHTFSPEDLNFPVTIVGVVKDHKYRSIDEAPIPMAWFNYAQIPIIGGENIELRVRTGDPLAILPAAQRALAQIDPNLPLIQPITQRAQYETTIAHQILFARLAGFFGLLAAVLVATGLYGMLAYRVQNRTIEIGVRIAVGAQRGQMVWMILRDSLILTGVGIAAGIPLSMFVGKALSSVLYGVQPYDPWSCAAAAVIVALVASASSAVPARRAASVDPLTALRSE
ncbi:MAG TPA: ABC transporter permease [Acidobacteriaceae bacterium]|nr:ABC transporter permease [Acidobacteriaceae bacterium]